jgi:xylan 1,4-beta-xylosidase
MSYWTYSDLFEEPGPPTAPFQGGFGLITPEGIRKPAFFAYKYLHSLQGSSIVISDPQAFFATKGGNVSAVIWDFEAPKQKLSDRPFYTQAIPAQPARTVQLRLNHLVPNSNYHLEVHRTGYQSNDAYTAYIEMGSPKELSKVQVSMLNDLTQDYPETDRMVESTSDGTIEISVPMKTNDIVLLKVQRGQEGQWSQAARIKPSH